MKYYTIKIFKISDKNKVTRYISNNYMVHISQCGIICITCHFPQGEKLIWFTFIVGFGEYT